MIALLFIGLFAAGQGLFQAFLLNSSRIQKSKDQTLLSLILIFLSLSVIEYAMIWTGNVSWTPHLIGFSTIAQFLFLPLAYFFFLENKNGKAHFHPIHFILFFIVVFQFQEFIFQSGVDKLAAASSVYVQDMALGLIDLPICMAFIFQSGFYLFLIARIKNKNEGILSKSIFRLLIGYYSIHIAHTTLIYFYPTSLQYVGIAILIMSIGAIYMISFLGYKRIDIIKEETTVKYLHSNLDKAQAMKIISKLNLYLQEELYFTNADIRMSQVATDIQVSKKHLSQSINQELSCSFREHLNNLRINYAKKLIQQEKTDRISLKEIAFDSGFNNKTSFANAFKKSDQMTPSQYLKQLS